MAKSSISLLIPFMLLFQENACRSPGTWQLNQIQRHAEAAKEHKIHWWGLCVPLAPQAKQVWAKMNSSLLPAKQGSLFGMVMSAVLVSRSIIRPWTFILFPGSPHWFAFLQLVVLLTRLRTPSTGTWLDGGLGSNTAVQSTRIGAPTWAKTQLHSIFIAHTLKVMTVLSKRSSESMHRTMCRERKTNNQNKCMQGVSTAWLLLEMFMYQSHLLTSQSM